MFIRRSYHLFRHTKNGSAQTIDKIHMNTDELLTFFRIVQNVNINTKKKENFDFSLIDLFILANNCGKEKN